MRVDGRVALAIAAGGFALVPACSLESLSGLTGRETPGDAGPLPDVTVEDAPPVDAPMGLDSPPPDTGRADAAPGVDAGADAASDAAPDGPAPEAGTWCQTHPHFFCSDWDEGSLTSQWTTVYAVGPGSANLDLTAFTSPPASFTAIVPMLASGTTSHQALVHQFPFTAKSLDIGFDLRIDELDTSSAQQPTETLAIVFDGPSNPYSIQLNLVANKTQLGQQVPSSSGGSTYSDQVFMMQPPLATWAHYGIHVDLGSSPSATATYDDAGVATLTITGYVQGTVTLQVGVAYTPGATTGTQVHYDNVTLDYQ